MDWKCGMDEQVEVYRGRMVWELLAKPSMEYVAEVWRSEGRSACKELELSQMKMSRRLLGATRVAVQGNLRWRKLEERREEMKVMFGKRLELLEEGRWLKMWQISYERLEDSAGGKGMSFEEEV